ERAGSDGCAYRHGVEHAGEMMVSRIVCLTGDLERTLDSGKGMAYSWCFDFCMDGHGVPSVVTGGQMTVVNAWTMQRLASSSLKPFSDCNTAEASVASAAARNRSISGAVPSSMATASPAYQGLVPTPPSAMRMKSIRSSTTLATTAADTKAN